MTIFEELEKRVAALEAQVQLLNARPTTVHAPVSIPLQPYVAPEQWKPAWSNRPYEITCDTVVPRSLLDTNIPTGVS